MVALLTEPPRPGTGPQEAVRPDGYTDSGWMRRLRDRREPADGAEEPVRQTRYALPPVPGVPLGGARPAADEEDDLDWGETFSDDDPAAAAEAPTPARRRLTVIGLLLLALALVVGFALWFGTNVLSVAGNVEQVHGSSPSATGTSAAASGGTATGSAPRSAPAPVAGAPVPITAAAVFDPYGDGESENAKAAPKSFDGNPATAWTTLNYRGSADFGHLKPGVGIVYDLGSAKPLAGVTLTTTLPGSTVEVRTASTPGTTLDAFPVAASGRLTGTDQLAFSAPVTARYVLVWVTGLVSGSDGFAADLAEVTVTAAG
jgi:putative peptidoglycan lipid II flippase